VRGVAILLVLVGHAHVPRTVGAGQVGVRLFFCLSGFLITALLLQELRASGRIDFRAFYVRRALRLLPALVASTVLVAVVGLILGPWFYQWRDGLAVLLYVGNWELVRDGLGGLTGTWSLSVEEQFYFVWPVLFFVLRKWSPVVLLSVTVAGIAGSLLVRYQLWEDGGVSPRLSYGTEVHIDALLGGALLAMWLVGRRVRTWSGWWAVLPAGVLVWGVMADGARFFMVTGVASLVGGVALVAVAAMSRDAWLSWGWLGWLGRRSYGIYLYHCPVSVYLDVKYPELGWEWRLPILWGIGIGLAVLSWRWIETPFLRRKPRPAGESPQHHRQEAPPVSG